MRGRLGAYFTHPCSEPYLIAIMLRVPVRHIGDSVPDLRVKRVIAAQPATSNFGTSPTSLLGSRMSPPQDRHLLGRFMLLGMQSQLKWRCLKIFMTSEMKINEKISCDDKVLV